MKSVYRSVMKAALALAVVVTIGLGTRTYAASAMDTCTSDCNQNCQIAGYFCAYCDIQRVGDHCEGVFAFCSEIICQCIDPDDPWLTCDNVFEGWIISS